MLVSGVDNLDFFLNPLLTPSSREGLGSGVGDLVCRLEDLNLKSATVAIKEGLTHDSLTLREAIENVSSCCLVERCGETELLSLLVEREFPLGATNRCGFFAFYKNIDFVHFERFPSRGFINEKNATAVLKLISQVEHTDLMLRIDFIMTYNILDVIDHFQPYPKGKDYSFLENFTPIYEGSDMLGLYDKTQGSSIIMLSKHENELLKVMLKKKLVIGVYFDYDNQVLAIYRNKDNRQFVRYPGRDNFITYSKEFIVDLIYSLNPHNGC
jgi:hypothetical protein